MSARSERITAQILACEEWAQLEVSRLEYRQARPPNHAVDPGGWELHQAFPWAAKIAEIECVLGYVSLCLNADLFGEPRPEAPSPYHREILDRFTGA